MDLTIVVILSGSSSPLGRTEGTSILRKNRMCNQVEEVRMSTARGDVVVRVVFVICKDEGVVYLKLKCQTEKLTSCKANTSKLFGNGGKFFLSPPVTRESEEMQARKVCC